jgi:hypothetical protein
LKITRRANDKEERGRWAEIFKALYNGLDSLAPTPLHTRVLAPVILLLK